MQTIKQKRKEGRMRRDWVKDIIKFVDYPWYIHRKEGDEKYDVYNPTDSEFCRLLEKDGITQEDLIRCDFGIVMGNSGCSTIDPFESKESALDWIREHADDFYFVKNTHPELKRLFPEIPVQKHPKEVEESFGIYEK